MRPMARLAQASRARSARSTPVRWQQPRCTRAPFVLRRPIERRRRRLAESLRVQIASPILAALDPVDAQWMGLGPRILASARDLPAHFLARPATRDGEA